LSWRKFGYLVGVAIESEDGAHYSVELHTRHDGVLIAMVGELDLASARYVRERLVEAVEGEPRAVRIDLSGVTFLDSTAVGLLVSTRRRVVSYGGAFSVRCESQVRQVIDTMGLLNFLNCS